MTSFTSFHVILQITLPSIVRSRTLMPRGRRVYHKRRSFLTFVVIWMIFFSLASWSIVKRAAADPNALWEHVVKCVNSQDGSHCKCCDNVRYIMPGATTNDDPTNHGYLVLFDSQARDAPGLTIPTRKITGIEANDLTHSPIYNYWMHAWEYVKNNHSDAAKTGKVGLAINSEKERDQNQLHIHMSCLHYTVDSELPRTKISTSWSEVTLTDPNTTQPHKWDAIRKDIKKENPFEVIRTSRQAKADMKDQNVLVTQVSSASQDELFILTSSDGSGSAMLYSKLDSCH